MTNLILQTAIDAAIDAGNEILKIYTSEDFGVEIKADNSPLTKADKAAHLKICSYLENTDYPILSEEGKLMSFDERKNWITFWLIDPLDGTKEFIKRNGEFTVNIALIENGTPILGVVYVPVTKEIYFADKEGAFKSIATEKGIDQNNTKKLPENQELDHFTVVGSRSHMSPETEEFIDNLDKKGLPLKMISKGSSLKLCLVAEGAAHCYPRLAPTMEWDTAAGHAIVKFSGKTVTRHSDKEDVVYNKKDLLNPFFIVQ